MFRNTWQLIRLGAFAAVLAAGVAMTARLTAGPALELARVTTSPAGVSAWTIDRLLGDLACALLLVATTGLGVVSGLAMTAALTVERAPGLSAVCSRIAPRCTGRLVAALLGLGLVAPSMVEGSALAGSQGHVTGCDVRCPHDGPLAGLKLPDLPSTRVGGDRYVGSERQIVVRQGECLWRIAEQRLPPRASDADVATLTWSLYALNRSTIGDDPDLIQPGMALIAPEGAS